MNPTSTGASPTRLGARLRRAPSRRWAVLGVLLTGVLLAGCKVPSFGGYPGATTQGQDEAKLWKLFFTAGLVVGGLVALLILFTVLRYRRRADTIPKQTQYHTVVEIIYTVVPILIVLGLFGFTVVTENEITAVAANPQARVLVTAFQWGWKFSYPGSASLDASLGGNVKDRPAIVGAANIVDGKAETIPNMVVPYGVTVQVGLQSLDVIHGFYVPQFNYSEYAQPGYMNHFDIHVLHQGVYRGQCTQLCGLYHSVMLFNVVAVSPGEFPAAVRLASQLPDVSNTVNYCKGEAALYGMAGAPPDSTCQGILKGAGVS